MNSLNGHITGVWTEGDLSMVSVVLKGEHTFEVMVIDTPETRSYLTTGHEVSLLFKETEVVLSVTPDVVTSIQNCIPCTISAIEKGKMLSRVHLESSSGKLAALLPSQFLDRLKLNKATPVWALIKFNEIMLSSK